MRRAFINTLLGLAKKDKKIFLLTGDLGFSVFEKFKEEFPERFFDIGVAEQNMMGIASGLALSGKNVFTYSIIPFLTMRCFEQIRNDVCYQDTNVKLIGIGAGFAYGSAGATHHAIEDIAIMRVLPNMTVVCPADPIETKLAIMCAAKFKGPVYIRIGKETKNIYSAEPDFEFGKGILVKKGKDIALISTGDMLGTVVEVAEKLSRRGISARVISMHTIKPLDEKIIFKAASETGAIFTVEEHSRIGGLGSAVAEVLLGSPYKNIVFERMGAPDRFAKKVGSQNYLRNEYGLSSRAIVKVITGLYYKNRKKFIPG